MAPHPTLVLGWREWVHLPDLGVDLIKAKLDTGARTSAIHANHITPFEKDDEEWVRFSLNPYQRDTAHEVVCAAAVLDQRRIRSSNGHVSRRYTIKTPLVIAGFQWDIELTLVSRDEMGFRLLLGRQALRGHALLDPGSSFAARKPPHARAPVPIGGP